MDYSDLSQCPRCGSAQGLQPVEIEKESIGCLMLLFGGFIPYLLYRSQQRQMMQCESCRLVFRPRQPFGRGDVIIQLLVFVLFGAFVIYVRTRYFR